MEFVSRCLTLAVIGVAISGCVSVQLSKDGEKVRVADPSQAGLMTKCQSKGQVYGESDVAPAQALFGLRNNAAEAKANVVVSRLEKHVSPGFFTPFTIYRGEAFSCPNDVYAKIVDSSKF
jgi:hypothetical protein